MTMHALSDSSSFPSGVSAGARHGTVRRGRPRLGEERHGASPSIRGRIPKADRLEFDEVIRRTGKNESELVREALRLLLEHYLGR